MFEILIGLVQQYATMDASVSTTTTGSGSEEEANVKFCFPNISPLSTE
jgi:hypothetical protein